MNENEQMPKVDLQKDGELLKNRSLLDYMKIVEKENLERVQRLQKLRRKNIVTALTLGAGVISIFAYSIYAVKQETFLDNFDEPERVEPATN